MDFDEVADRLYGLPPESFTAARDTAVAEAKKAGEGDLSSSIKKLKRPTVSAWMVNVLSHERGDEIGRLLELGRALRDAQDSLAADQLRQLSQQRNNVITALTGEATRLASEGGRQVGEAARREVQETLEAALGDPSAAEAVRQGRLTSALAYSGLGFHESAQHPVKAAQKKPGKAAAPKRDEQVRELEQAVDEQRREVQSLQRSAEKAESQLSRLNAKVSELEEKLQEARTAAAKSAKAARDAERARSAGEKALAEAEEKLRQLAE